MASLLLRGCRRPLSASTVCRINHTRFVSSIPYNNWGCRQKEFLSDKATDASSATKHYATAAGQPHIEPVQQHLKPEQYGFQQRNSLIQNLRVEVSGVAPTDPLQHILDHPSASIILRDACKCTRCKDDSTSQRNFNLAHIPVDLKPSTAKQDAHGNWVIQWQNDMSGWEDHVSIFTPQQIERLRVYMQNDHRMPTQLWSKKDYEKNGLRIPYEEYMHSDAGLAKALYYFASHGLVMIEGVPEDPHAVETLAERIATMKSTFYGPTWDIKSVPNAKNVAFTNKYLGFHGDLMYLKEPPTVQYLHCIHNSCVGGESRFVDNFKALDTLYSEAPDLAEILGRIRLRYEYENDGHYYSDIKPIVQWRTDGHQFPRRNLVGAANQQMHDVYRVFWGPQFLGSIISDLGVSEAELKRRVAAMRKYAEILERDDLVYEEKMIPGTCVMFDNLRVLHARNEFDMNTGQRWLRGTYVDGQDLWSLEVKLKDHMARLQMATEA